MKHFLFAASLLFLAGCSIDIEETHPIVEQVFLQEEASNGGIVCTIDGSYPHIKNLSSVQVEVNINATLDELALTMKEVVRNCQETLNDITELDAAVLDSTTVSYDVKLLNDKIFSVTILSSQMLEGAAHPTNTIDAFVFDLSSGQPVTLSDYFANTPGYEGILEQAIVQALQKEDMDLDGTLRNPVEKFYLTEDALVLVDLFDVYALKGFEVTIPLLDRPPKDS
ncbi:hypothetical protein COU75_00375 [Candidatus Peregrinibacteria bacterium CG10_big_fil_rev_8_21_14_0_10_42_8]|nr:MAG: hypothetical protein COU75_00375 [Candidatus Peregrinibacteria bacterium CG10_big_fil_rev_8_21_14_0_10_42_8]